MESLALSLGVIPFLAGRTVLAAGLLALFFAAKGVLERRELSLRAVVLGICAGFLSLAIQGVASRVRQGLSELTELTREWVTLANRVFVTLLSLTFAAYAMGMLGTQVWERAMAMVPQPVALAGLLPDAWKLLVVGVVAWGFASLRERLASLFSLLPLSEMSGLGRMLFLAEAGWTALGLVVAVAFPWVGAALAVISLGLLLSAVLLLRQVTEGGRGTCTACERGLHLSASACPSCRAARTPSRLGLLGRAGEGAPPDAGVHRLHLLAVRRCPTCAERLNRDHHQPCAACGGAAFASEAESREFVRHVDARMVALLPAFAALGLLPGLGLVLALLLYKLAPSGALGGYARWQQALGTRLLRSAALLALALLQPVPLVGALSSAALISLMQPWARKAFLSSAQAPQPA